MVVPRLVQQALRGESLTVYGDGTQSRCFLHVQDAVDALILLAGSSEAVGKVFNVGSVESVTINALAQKILERIKAVGIPINQNLQPICYIPYEKAYTEGFEDMAQRLPDISRIQSILGWKPRFSLDNILDDVIRYYRNPNPLK